LGLKRNFIQLNLKHLIIPILLVLFFIDSYCQSSESVNLKVTYRTIIKKSNSITVNDTCVLNISSNYSYFYSRGKQKYDSLLLKSAGELLSKSLPGNQYKVEIPSIARYFPYGTYKKYKNAKSYIIRSLGKATYSYSINDIYNIKWDIKNETSVINNLKCFKAIAKIDTSMVEVWFCPDIPISDGPAIYSGLPGLIIQTKSTSGLHIELISFEKNNNSKEINKYPVSYEEVTYKEFNNALKAIREKVRKGEYD
jgi:GLPGLI family protein